MKFKLEIEFSDAETMNRYARSAVAAAILSSPHQRLGFVLDHGATVAKWEREEDAPAVARDPDICSECAAGRHRMCLSPDTCPCPKNH